MHHAAIEAYTEIHKTHTTDPNTVALIQLLHCFKQSSPTSTFYIDKNTSTMFYKTAENAAQKITHNASMCRAMVHDNTKGNKK